MDWECSRCDVPHRAQIARLPDVIFQVSGHQYEGAEALGPRRSWVATLLDAEVGARTEESASLEDACRRVQKPGAHFDNVDGLNPYN